MSTFRFDIPVIETDRLTLRGARRGDFEVFAEMLSHERTSYMGGPFDREGAWALFCNTLANWPLDGFGGWLITDKTTGQFLGDVGIMQPDPYPEPELGWTLIQTAEGKGYAFEAAKAARDWYWANTSAETVVSYVTPGNTRSEALATRLGATPDPDAPLPTGETRDGTTVYRHRRPR